MIELQDDKLVFRFPEVHPDAVCRIEFQRTLRIPDDNREYGLPPGLGRFPVRHVDDHRDTSPESWGGHGGVFLPMYQAEAMWLNFDTAYPMAIKVAAGKIDALTGESWTNELSRRPQNYLTVPNQPWLDGFCVGKGMIRQFVAMPLGQGYTAEEQLTGTAEHGGLQIIAYPMQAVRYEAWAKKQAARDARTDGYVHVAGVTIRDGPGAGRSHASEDLPGQVRLRNVGPVGAFPLLRAYSQQRAVPPGVGRRATQHAAYGQGLHRRRAALVRLLRWRPHRTRRCAEADGPGQCGREETQAGRGSPRGQRSRTACRRQDAARRPRARGRVLNRPRGRSRTPGLFQSWHTSERNAKLEEEPQGANSFSFLSPARRSPPPSRVSRG